MIPRIKKISNGGELTEHSCSVMIMAMPKLLFKILGLPVPASEDNEKKASEQGKQKNSSKPTKEKSNSTKSSIPYLYAYENGIIEIEQGKFSKSYHIPEINFLSGSDDFQKKIALMYAQFLSIFSDRIDVEITLYNQSLDMETFKNDVFLPMQGDSLDEFRDELNLIRMEKMTKAKSNLVTVKVMTITLESENIEIATSKFENEIERLIADNLEIIVQEPVTPLTIIERMDLLYSIYNQETTRPLYEKRIIDGHEVESFSLEKCMREGISTKDVISPSGIIVQPKFLKVGSSVCRTYYVADFPSWFRGDILSNFMSVPANLIVSIYMNAMNPGKAMKLIKEQRRTIGGDVVEKQKQSKGLYDSSIINPDADEALKELERMGKNLSKDDSKLFNTSFYFTLMAPDEETLQSQENMLIDRAASCLMTLKPMTVYHEKGFNSSLPLGNKQIPFDRILDSYSIATMIPFSMKNYMQGQIFMGINAKSKTMVFFDPDESMNANTVILGKSGTGKSFFGKEILNEVLCGTNDTVFIIDPNGEYLPYAQAYEGTVVKISSASESHINPFELNLDNTNDEQNDPIKTKCDFVLTLCEIMIGDTFGLDQAKKSIISECAMKMYQNYAKELVEHGLTYSPETAPTILDFYNLIYEYPNPVAKNLAMELKRFVDGPMTTFAHHTNVDIHNRLVIYDIKDIGNGLKEMGLHICLDNILNQMSRNFRKGIRTWVAIDEFHRLLDKESTADYSADIWKTCRKLGGAPIAITQDIGDMLSKKQAQTILSNSQQVILLEQAPINLAPLAKMYSLSEEEKKMLSTSKPGNGLLLYGKDIIPIDMSFPKETKLYSIMSTKFGDQDVR